MTGGRTAIELGVSFINDIQKITSQIPAGVLGEFWDGETLNLRSAKFRGSQREPGAIHMAYADEPFAWMMSDADEMTNHFYSQAAVRGWKSNFTEVWHRRDFFEERRCQNPEIGDLLEGARQNLVNILAETSRLTVFGQGEKLMYQESRTRLLDSSKFPPENVWEPGICPPKLGRFYSGYPPSHPMLENLSFPSPMIQSERTRVY